MVVTTDKNLVPKTASFVSEPGVCLADIGAQSYLFSTNWNLAKVTRRGAVSASEWCRIVNAYRRFGYDARGERISTAQNGIVNRVVTSYETVSGEVWRVRTTTRIATGADMAKLKHKVRLDLIDAPEKDQPWGEESAAVLKGWIFGKSVRVAYEKRDQYGRILGVIYNGTNDVNLAMVRTGNAWHYSHFDKTPEYAAAEAEARVARRGLWSQENPVNPCQWRRAHRK